MPTQQAEREGSMAMLREYRRTEDLHLRNEVLMSYLPIVRSAAGQFRGILSGNIQEEDLINQGVLALMDCLDKYDETKGAKFETYAFLRVRGALIDYIRRQDWVPHQARRLGKQVQEAYMELANQNMREPTMTEIAGHMGIPQEKLEKNRRDMNNSVVLSFENMLQDFSCFAEQEKLQIKDRSSIPEESYLYKELNECLANAIKELPERERLVITLYYYEELKYTEIAEILEVGESRVSQIHSKAIMKLRQSLEQFRKG